MALVICPEEGCGNQVSAYANFCPRCGFVMSRSAHNGLEPWTVGIPLGPLHYWEQWHFWYWRGCTGATQVELAIDAPGWIEQGEELISMDAGTIRSPLTGLLIGCQLNYKWCTTDISLPALYKRQMTSKIEEFIEIQPVIGSFKPDIGQIFSGVVDYIEAKALKQWRGPFAKIRERLWGDEIDPKKRFSSNEEFLLAARTLYDISAFKLK